MIFEHRSFWMPKDVRNRQGYQDAAEFDASTGIAAIADGASSSLFSGSWAKILTRGVVGNPPDVSDREGFAAWLDELRELWREPIDDSVLAWHQKPKLQDGAHSTLLWIQLTATAAGAQMTSFAIGDCCLFHFRDGKPLRAFPLEKSNLFDATPDMLGSVSKEETPTTFQHLADECRHGDILALCTDALAVWTLGELEAGRDLDWGEFWAMTPDEFEERITELRADDAIRFDDTTLLLLKIVEGEDEAPAGSELDDLVDDVKASIDDVKEKVQETSDRLLKRLRRDRRRRK
ncbi:MAG: protein phosphatase 2C domain-containing protein [Pirellulaceae bacterium]|jgi:hypothetical protein|nr:protein phosphatase 2C domain-containing protein [Pirellulaceae bacterium]MDP7015796.1 protein phosphatase 2C domain-containing protein [Pirellulaceae bacterium]